MTKISRHTSSRHAQLALRLRTADSNFERVSTIAGSTAAKRNIREEQQLEIQQLEAELLESEQLKVLHGLQEKLVTPELAYLHSFNNVSSQDLSDGSTLLAKQKLVPSSENLRQAQEENSSSKDRRGQLIDILV